MGAQHAPLDEKQHNEGWAVQKSLTDPWVGFARGRDDAGLGEGGSRRQVTHSPSVLHPSLPAGSFKPALNSVSKTQTHGVFCLFPGELGQLKERVRYFPEGEAGLSSV